MEMPDDEVADPAVDPAPGTETSPGPDPGRGASAGRPGDDVDGSAKTWATAGHLSAFVWLIGIPGPIGPLVVWLLKRGEHTFIDDQAKEALNFHLSIVIYMAAIMLVSILLMLPTFGLAILPGAAAVLVIGLLSIVFTVIAAYHASEGERYRYPLTMRLIS